MTNNPQELNVADSDDDALFQSHQHKEPCASKSDQS